ncbi:MAG: polysaccharide pyruvyl transferase family protein [Balneolales bacterium]
MKILQVASFIGNIGDNASHMGFRNILNQIIGNDYQIDELEIRKFYKNYNLSDKSYFDKNFATLANQYDLLFIGGGGFLDYWIDGSCNGTSFDISESILDCIEIPIIIGSVGSRPHKAVPKGNIEKYKRFLIYINSRENMYVLLRNDGSKEHLEKEFGNNLVNDIPEILDHAFFYLPPPQLCKIFDRKYILINSTLDQLKMQSDTNNLTSKEYHEEMRRVIQFIITKTIYDVLFAPHIYNDINAAIQLLDGIDDYNIRKRIKIAPYIQGNEGANFIFNLYNDSVMNIGMRFHANVCSLGLGKTTVGLSALSRVQCMYNSINNPNVIKIKKNFSDVIIKKISGLNASNNPNNISYLKNLMEDTKSKYSMIFKNIIRIQ